MREYLTVDRIANTIRQQTITFEGSFILVEGDSDKKLYQNFVNESNCRFQICKGKPSSKQRVIQALDILNQDKIKGIIGIVDADFDHLENTQYNHNNLFLTDDHDLEIMLIKSPALDKLLKEFASEDKLSELKSDIREVLLNLSYELGYLRWISKCDQLNLTFNDLDYKNFLEIKSLNTDSDKLIQTVINKTQNYSISKEDLLNKINIQKSDAFCKYQICCGHDMIEILSISVLFGFFIYYFRKGKIKKLNLVEFINIAISAATIVSSCSLIYRVITSEELLNLLQFDIYALLLGAMAVIWLSFQQIISIFK